MFELFAKKDGESNNKIDCSAGVMPQNGELCFGIAKCGEHTIGFDTDGNAYCEIEDGLEVEVAKEIATDIILSDKTVYKGLRDKFVVTITLLPEELMRMENGIMIKFEDKEKYLKREKAR